MRVPVENPFKCSFRDALKDPIGDTKYFPMAEDGSVIFILKEARIPFQGDLLPFHQMSDSETDNGMLEIVMRKLVLIYTSGNRQCFSRAAK
jgi:hypothetical protein